MPERRCGACDLFAAYIDCPSEGVCTSCSPRVVRAGQCCVFKTNRSPFRPKRMRAVEASLVSSPEKAFASLSR